MKRFFIILALSCFSAGLWAQNDGMFDQKRERKRLWRRHRGNKERKNKTAYNPYLEKKAKNKPSAKMSKGDKKELRRQKKAARKQMRHSKRKVND